MSNMVSISNGASQGATTSVERVVEFLVPLVRPGALPLVVLIGGCARTGKTWLANAICECMRRRDLPACRIPLDAWLIGIDERPPQSTVIERYECRSIIHAVHELTRRRPVYPPVYDPVTRRRVASRTTEPLQVTSGLLLVDGVIALALPELRSLAAVRIFVSTPDRVRLKRLQEFYRVVKGLAVDADAIIQERDKEEVPFVMQTKQWADLFFETKDEA